MNYAVDAYLSVHYYDYQENENKLKHFLSNVFGILLSIGGVFILVISFIGYLIFLGTVMSINAKLYQTVTVSPLIIVPSYYFDQVTCYNIC